MKRDKDKGLLCKKRERIFIYIFIKIFMVRFSDGTDQETQERRSAV